jgi:5-methylcytosine-specific restriction protein A
VRKPWQPTHGIKRIAGRKLQRLRRQLFQAEPLCVLCLAHGKATIATIRDHRIPLADHGTDTEENCQPVCHACHEAKTHAEAARGRQRGRL